MVSADGSRSLHGASDELYDIICGPCQTDNLGKKANHYCNECREYLCNLCKDAHRKLAMSKSHTILFGRKIPAHTSLSQRSGFVAYCGCNKNQKVEFYCGDHKEIICSPCKMVKHRNCQKVDVQEKSADYTTARLNSLVSKMKSLIHEFGNMLKQRISERKVLKRLTEDCKKKIKDFRAETDIFLDNLEQRNMQEVDEFDKDQSRHINQHITALTTGLQMLNADNKQLEDAKTDGSKVKMFATDVQVSKSLEEYEAMLTEMENNMSEPTLSFEGNKKLAEFQTEITSLGSLKGTGKSLGLSLSLSDKGGNKSNKTILLGMKATLKDHVSVRLSDDKSRPSISVYFSLYNQHMKQYIHSQNISYVIQNGIQKKVI